MSSGTGGCAQSGTLVCTAGSVTCSATPRTSGTCTSPVNGGCIASGDCACLSGTHDCGGTCVFDTSVYTCGTSCSPCPVPTRGSATCTAGLCSLVCPSPYVLCGSSCEFLSATCTVGVGACQRVGTRACVGGTVGCSVVPGAPTGERCNGIDDDCNGSVDDGGVCTVVEISAGYIHTCARVADGSLRCWGNNSSGQLGNGTTVDPWAVVSVSGISSAVEISLGNNMSCAREITDNILCWGSNSDGKLGTGLSATLSTIPVMVSGAAGSRGIAAGNDHVCVRMPDGTARCWGNNLYGQLGDGTTSNRSTPVPVSGLVNVVDIGTGQSHSCAVINDGTVRCWGSNGVGELGDGTTVSRSTPITVVGLRNAVRIAVGSRHACAMLSDGTVSCWGWEFGTGTPDNQTRPVAVSGISGAVEIGAGFKTTCIRDSSGRVICWGNRIGYATDPTPCRVPTGCTYMRDAVEISVGYRHACARRVSGEVACWGWNLYMQCGDGGTAGTNTILETPTTVNVAP